ncbi:uncharacterized protein [Apostichopus japonicus]|uniref:uncharacterized protein isoform X2 n=1 Tax=Stichopus japonicus TaxID=307972 RepID=UPI003AB1DC20
MVHHLIFPPCDGNHINGKCGLISLEMIFGGHMVQILHRMAYNMVMVILFSTYLLYISFKKVKEKVKLEHITTDITSIVDPLHNSVIMESEDFN